MEWNGYDAGTRISVNKGDGSVIISHNGCEIGQGINTKCVQAVAYTLNLDVSLFRVAITNTESITNGGPTGGSGTSEVVCQAAINACNTLIARLQEYCTNGVYDIKSTEDWIKLLASLPYDVSLNVEG